MYKITYTIKKTRHQRGTKPTTLTNLSKQDAKDWTSWLNYKRAQYTLIKY